VDENRDPEDRPTGYEGLSLEDVEFQRQLAIMQRLGMIPAASIPATRPGSVDGGPPNLGGDGQKA